MNLSRKITVAFLLAFLLCRSEAAIAQQSDDQQKSNYNWEVATLGGTQFWTDVHVEGGWRIQKNAYFGHFRLLDNSNVRIAWGKKTACIAELKKRVDERSVTPYRGKVVFLLHGLGRSWKSMKTMGKHLEKQGYTVIFFRYASTRKDVADHASKLRDVIDGLPKGVTDIHFVAHSLGNIVIRHYVNDCNKSELFDPDSRIRRMVMLGPPNQGSRMARLLKESVTFKVVAGASGAQLSGGWDDLNKNLATPSFEFGIIAGGYGADDASMSNFLLPGPDDFTVSKKETMLVGASDFLVRPLVHTTMMNQPEVLKATTRFLHDGYFISAESMRPIDSLPVENAKK